MRAWLSKLRRVFRRAGIADALVLKDCLVLAVVGIVAGVPLVVAGGRAASAVLFGVGSADPALRASRIQPTDALRHE